MALKKNYTREILVGVLSLTVLAEVVLFMGGFAFLRQGINLASVLPGVVTSLTNEARSDEHLLALTQSDLLAQGAQMKAEDMARRGYFSHADPDGSPPWKWFDAVGYRYEYAGENLAVNFSESEDVVDAWLKSPTHRANILKQNFTEIGIGTAKGMYKGKETTFVVQFFGKPAIGPVAQASDSGRALNTAPEDFLSTGEVLGTSTSVIEQFVSSPHTPTKTIFYIIAGIFAFLLLCGILFGKRFPRLWPTIAILLSIAVLLGYAILNKDTLLGTQEEMASSDIRVE